VNPLAGFSDWALALLPRLFLYPGGLTVAAALLLALFMSRPATGTARTSLLRETLHLAATANIPALACAWVALSILPLPGLAPLPSPVDRFSVVAIIAASLLFDLAGSKEDQRDELWPGVAIVLALMSPVALQRGLMPGGADPGAVGYLAGAAVLAGLVGLFGGVGNGWSNAARWLAWWGAAFALGLMPGGTWGWISLPAALVLGWVAQRLGWGRYATMLAYVLGLGALVTALLLPPG
jgi:hypothetical protein